MLNNAEHLEAYLADPLHGRRAAHPQPAAAPEQLVWIVNHAEDRVIIVNGSLLPLLAPLLAAPRSVEHVVVVGAGDRVRRSTAPHARGARVRGAARGPPDHVRLARAGRTPGRRHVLHLRHHGRPQGRRLQPPLDLPALHAGQHGRVDGPAPTRTPSLVVVPQFHVNAWGLPHATFMTGVNMLMPDRFLQPAPARRDDRERAADARPGPSPPSGRACWRAHRDAPRRRLVAARRSPSAARPVRPRSWRPSTSCGVRDLPRLGHDGDLPAGHRRPTAGRGVGRARSWRTASPRAASRPASRPGWSAPAASGCPGTASPAGELEVRGPWIAGATTAARTPNPAPRRQVQRGRLAADRRRRHHHPRRLPHPHRPRQGRHQVRRRVDLLGGPGERPHGPPGRRRGRRRRRPRRQVGRAAARGGRARRAPRPSWLGRTTPPCSARGSGNASPAGRCPSDGRSSTRCRARRWASSTRSSCGHVRRGRSPATSRCRRLSLAQDTAGR